MHYPQRGREICDLISIVDSTALEGEVETVLSDLDGARSSVVSRARQNDEGVHQTEKN